MASEGTGSTRDAGPRWWSGTGITPRHGGRAGRQPVYGEEAAAQIGSGGSGGGRHEQTTTVRASERTARDPSGGNLDDEVELSPRGVRSEEHTSELQSLMRISYAVFCLKKKTNTTKLNKKTH